MENIILNIVSINTVMMGSVLNRVDNLTRWLFLPTAEPRRTECYVSFHPWMGLPLSNENYVLWVNFMEEVTQKTCSCSRLVPENSPSISGIKMLFHRCSWHEDFKVITIESRSKRWGICSKSVFWRSTQPRRFSVMNLVL